MLAMADSLFKASPGVPFVRTYCIEKVTSRSKQTVRTTYKEGPCTLGKTPRGYEIFGHNWEKGSSLSMKSKVKSWCSEISANQLFLLKAIQHFTSLAKSPVNALEPKTIDQSRQQKEELNLDQ